MTEWYFFLMLLDFFLNFKVWLKGKKQIYRKNFQTLFHIFTLFAKKIFGFSQKDITGGPNTISTLQSKPKFYAKTHNHNDINDTWL